MNVLPPAHGLVLSPFLFYLVKNMGAWARVLLRGRWHATQYAIPVFCCALGQGSLHTKYTLTLETPLLIFLHLI